MKFLYLTILFIIVALAIFLLLSCIPLIGGATFYDVITNQYWDIFGSLIGVTIATFVVTEEGRRIKIDL
jgi:hypothetical protein